jgi:hexosaminidase
MEWFLMPLTIIPQPVEAKQRPGSFGLASARVICLDTVGGDARFSWVGQYLADWLVSGGGDRVPVLLDTQRGSVSTGSIRLIQDPDSRDLGDEGYQLSVDKDHISITARYAAGAFYGVQTLIQLATGGIKNGSTPCLPCVRIKDRPRFPWRGFMLDSARHMQSVSEVKRIIDRLAALKLNRFHWHIADDQGWRLEIRKHPRLTSVGAWRGEGSKRYGGFYTQRQVRDIVAYANDRCITVIPEIDMPGHCNAALHAFPELSCTGEPISADAEGGLNAYTRSDGRRLFCAGRDNVLAFLKDVLAEVAEVFDPPYIHLGGDERPSGIWSKCPRCIQRMQQLGLESEDELELWFASQIATFAHEQLKVRTIGWGDNLKKAGMPGGQIVQGWLEGQSAMAVGVGRQTINSFHEWVYLDYPWCEESRQGKPDWMPLLSVEKVYGFEPVPDGLSAGEADLVLGGEATVWTEYVETYEFLIRHVMPRLLAFSEVLWSPRDARNFNDFEVRAAQFTSSRQPTRKPEVQITKPLEFGKNILDKQASPS